MSSRQSDVIRGFARTLEIRAHNVFVTLTILVYQSIVFGSPITGAPGQPVDTATLRDSWIGEFVSASRWQLTTNVEYAQHVEDNVRGVIFRNHGSHSVMLTVVNFDRLVAAATHRGGNIAG